MIKKTLYFGNPAYLSLSDGQMVIRIPEVENADVPDLMKKETTVTRPIEDIGVVVIDNRRITLTSGLMDALLQNNVAVIMCDERRMPSGLFLPLEGHTLQSERFRSQLEASLPLRKQLWQQTVSAKISNQHANMAYARPDLQEKDFRCLKVWAGEVKSGDPDNLEGRAAAFYWKNLFASLPDFVRSREGEMPNALLNYGYAILRAIIARSLVGSGLLPTFGIHHHNRYNAYCLADDVMEPYRPYVDRLVVDMLPELGTASELTREVKAEMLAIPTLDVTISDHQRPLMIAASETTSSLARCFAGEARRVAYPEM